MPRKNDAPLPLPATVASFYAMVLLHDAGKRSGRRLFFFSPTLFADFAPWRVPWGHQRPCFPFNMLFPEEIWSCCGRDSCTKLYVLLFFAVDAYNSAS